MSAVVITASFQLDLFARLGISYLRCRLDLIQIKSLCPETPASPISMRCGYCIGKFSKMSFVPSVLVTAAPWQFVRGGDALKAYKRWAGPVAKGMEER
jgi:hypothetical protein